MMNIKNVASNQLLFTTVKIHHEETNDGIECGTGFFYSFNSADSGKAFNALITCWRENIKDGETIRMCNKTKVRIE